MALKQGKLKINSLFKGMVLHCINKLQHMLGIKLNAIV